MKRTLSALAVLPCLFAVGACEPHTIGLRKDYVAASAATNILLNQLSEAKFRYSTERIWISPKEFPQDHVDAVNQYLEPFGTGQRPIWPNCIASFAFGTGTGNGTSAVCTAAIAFPEIRVHVTANWKKYGTTWKLISLHVVPITTDSDP